MKNVVFIFKLFCVHKNRQLVISIEKKTSLCMVRWINDLKYISLFQQTWVQFISKVYHNHLSCIFRENTIFSDLPRHLHLIIFTPTQQRHRNVPTYTQLKTKIAMVHNISYSHIQDNVADHMTWWANMCKNQCMFVLYLISRLQQSHTMKHGWALREIQRINSVFIYELIFVGSC